MSECPGKHLTLNETVQLEELKRAMDALYNMTRLAPDDDTRDVTGFHLLRQLHRQWDALYKSINYIQDDEEGNGNGKPENEEPILQGVDRKRLHAMLDDLLDGEPAYREAFESIHRLATRNPPVEARQPPG